MTDTPASALANTATSSDLSIIATGLVREFHEAGVLNWADVQVARRIVQLSSVTDEEVELAAALAVWAVRAGSVCIDLSTIATETFDRGEERADTSELAWPAPADWVARIAASPAVGCEPDTRLRREPASSLVRPSRLSGVEERSDEPTRLRREPASSLVRPSRLSGVEERSDEPGPRRPLRLVGTRLYLDRYWREEERVRESLQSRIAQTPPAVDEQLLDAQLDQLFTDDPSDLQRLACRTAATSWVSVIAGGPGTGKTTTIGRLLIALDALGIRRVALAAPTGKAAVRLGEAISAAGNGLSEPVTLHRLLGLRPGAGPAEGAAGRLPYDVIVVDEMSMVSLPLMARLLTAARNDARLVLVGDPNQLASVEAGAVLADLTESPPSGLKVVHLTKNYRFGSSIARLADAIRDGDADSVQAQLREGSEAVTFIETELLTPPTRLQSRIASVGSDLYRAAAASDVSAALEHLDAHRVLCGHRRGFYGVSSWNRHAQRWIADIVPEFGSPAEWHIGRPVLVTHNDPELGLHNGDTGVVIATTDGLRVAFPGGRTVPISVLDDVMTAHAMTVHKAQGSQFAEVSLIVPPPGSPLLTRQLLYTAVTRAKQRLTVYGQSSAIAEAVTRPALRASGLRSRL